MLKVVIVGSGYGGYCLAPSFQTLGHEISGIVTSDNKNIDHLISRYDIKKIFYNLDDAIDAISPSVIALAVPPISQYDLLKKCSLHNIPVFAEKPLGINLLTAEKIFKFWDPKIPNVVDFMFPFINEWTAAKELLESNHIGEIHHVIVEWSFESYDNMKKINTWKTDATKGGGVLLHFGSHVIYYLEHMIGSIKEISGTSNHYKNYTNSGDTFVNASIEFNSGATGSMTLCNSAIHGQGHKISIYGEKGALFLINNSDNPVKFELYTGKRNTPIKKINVSHNFDLGQEDPRVEPVSKLCKLFIENIYNANMHALPSIHSAYRAHTLINKIINTPNFL